MTIEIGFVDGDNLVIENVCPMNRLVSDLQKKY